ncbi:GNAT family N-acetyltransferase [Halorubrum lipolyticum]|uniref:GCN5-related N-acetyltransferase n=1 Tax=Halorubrum lipolyticum DSM 21995 TaxID=1227482 RepID=M0NX78_9EURY|nr:GNAT family N-acetyltransferase [Halorubrum lipolyticum]EMA62426.1 GCN5-related N-acetyltransferase [Halorubrum lipolyticum DSM 21995]
MHVRAARPDDAEALRTAVSRAREATVFDDIGAPLLDVSAAGVREAAAEAEWSFLMEDEEGPVGVAIAHPDAEESVDGPTAVGESADDPGGAGEGDREAELLALWVHPNHAGEGVASELLARVASSVADHGVGTLRASVPADSPGATEFFSAHGFAHRETRRGPAGDESIVVTDVDALR